MPAEREAETRSANAAEFFAEIVQPAVADFLARRDDSFGIGCRVRS